MNDRIQQCEHELFFPKGATEAVLQPQRPTRLDLFICGRRLVKGQLIVLDSSYVPAFIRSVRVGDEEQIATGTLPVEMFRCAGGVPLPMPTMTPGTKFTIELAAPAERDFYMTCIGRELVSPEPPFQPSRAEEREPSDGK